MWADCWQEKVRLGVRRLVHARAPSLTGEGGRSLHPPAGSLSVKREAAPGSGSKILTRTLSHQPLGMNLISDSSKQFKVQLGIIKVTLRMARKAISKTVTVSMTLCVW